MIMEDKVVTLSDGSEVDIQVQPGTTDAQITSYLGENLGAFKQQQAEKQAAEEPMSLGDVATGVRKNFARSGIDMVKDLSQAVLHPVDTATSLLQLAKGAVQLAIPGEQGSEEQARQVGRFFKKRYGTFEKAKRTLAADPVGFMGDFSMFLTGGGTAIAKVGGLSGKMATLGKTLGDAYRLGSNKAGVAGAIEKAVPIGKELARPTVAGATAGPNMLQGAGEAIARFGNQIDPLTMAAKGVKVPFVGKIPGVANVVAGAGGVAADLQGVMTGRGGMVTREAFKAGMKGKKNRIFGGDKDFESGVQHLDDADALVADAENMLTELSEQRKADYSAKFEKMVQGNKGGKYDIDVQPIYNKMVALSKSLMDNVTGKYSVITDAGEQANILKIGEEAIKIFNDPAMHNALGMDHLKKMLDNINIPHGATSSHKQASRIRATMASMIKNEIKKKVPGYEAMLRPYEQGLKLERDLQRSFALGGDGHVDTIIKKLQQSLTQGVHSGLGSKRSTLDKLDPSGQLVRRLSGHQLSSTMPSGMIRAGMGVGAGVGGGAGGFMLGGPGGAALGAGATIAAQSPRLTGKLNYGMGRLAAPVYKASQALGEGGMRNVGRGLVAEGRRERAKEKEKKNKKKGKR